jgi:hypothetical protein
VPHGGRNSCHRGVWRQMYILEIFGSSIYFSKSKAEKYKKILKPDYPHPRSLKAYHLSTNALDIFGRLPSSQITDGFDFCLIYKFCYAFRYILCLDA